MKKCIDCGKELPNDSEFCQYCGSHNLTAKHIVYKRCLDCGKELPNDSEFCQYCGSKKVAIVNNGKSPNRNVKIQKPKKKVNKKLIALLVLIPILLTIVLIGWAINVNKNSGGTDTVKSGVVVNNMMFGASSGSYKLVVRAPKDDDVLVFIRSINTPKNTMYVTVRRGGEFPIHFQYGQYEVYYVLGDRWNRNTLSFEFFAKYYREKNVLNTRDLSPNYYWCTDFNHLDENVEKISVFEYLKAK